MKIVHMLRLRSDFIKFLLFISHAYMSRIRIAYRENIKFVKKKKIRADTRVLNVYFKPREWRSYIISRLWLFVEYLLVCIYKIFLQFLRRRIRIHIRHPHRFPCMKQPVQPDPKASIYLVLYPRQREMSLKARGLLKPHPRKRRTFNNH